MPNHPNPLATIRELVDNDLTATNTFIINQLSTDVPFIKALGEHILQSGGKRLRPLIVLLSANLFNYTGNEHITLAAVIECIHTATLLHDDVVDASELRRGKKTANAIWGNEASILVGDFLYSRTFQLVVQTGCLTAMSILATATNCLAEGEVIQLLNVSKTQLDETTYYDVIERKTATLFAAAAQMGAILTERDAWECDALARFGHHVGMAFQLIDDVLDYASDASCIGKNIGDDLAKGKMTLPLIYALQVGDANQRDCIERAIQSPGNVALADIIAVLNATDALAYTRDCAIKQADDAIAALVELPDNCYRQGLIELANFAVAREF